MLKKWLPGLIGLSALALLGRTAGFVREILMASKFGASSITDAYLTTIILFDLAIAANNSIISGTLSYLSEQSESDKSFTKNLRKLSWIALTVMIVLSILLFPLIDWAVPHLFSYKEQETRIIIDSTKILLILISFVISCGILSSALQLKGKLSIPGGLTIFLNGFSILSLFFLSSSFGIISIPIGLLSGSVLFFLYQLFLTTKGSPSKREPQKIIIIPWLLSSLLVFGNLLLPNVIAFFERYFALQMNVGTFSHYAYAGKLALLPLTIFGYAISTSLLPIQTKYLQDNNRPEFDKITTYGFLVSLVSAGLLVNLFYVFADPIVKIIYEHGHFTFTDTNSTAATLRIYTIGLFPFLIAPIIANVFYSLRITKYLFFIGISSMLMNIILLVIFVRIVPDSKALALSSVIAAWVNLAISIIFLSRCGNKLISKKIAFVGLTFIVIAFIFSLLGKSILESIFPLSAINLLTTQQIIVPTLVGFFLAAFVYLSFVLMMIRKDFPELFILLKGLKQRLIK